MEITDEASNPGGVGAIAVVAGLTLPSATAGAALDRTAVAWNRAVLVAATANLNVVHGIPGLDVDIYVVKNFNIFGAKELSDVTFGTAADLNTAFPGFITPGFYTIDIVAHGGNPFQPVLITSTYLGAGQSETAVAYTSADAAGNPGSPTLTVFHNDISATKGQARVTVAHTAVAPTVGSARMARSPWSRRSPTVNWPRPWSPRCLHGDGHRTEQLLGCPRRPDRTRDAGGEHDHAGLCHRHVPEHVHRCLTRRTE